jgi:hypothetical protein
MMRGLRRMLAWAAVALLAAALVIIMTGAA